MCTRIFGGIAARDMFVSPCDYLYECEYVSVTVSVSVSVWVWVWVYSHHCECIRRLTRLRRTERKEMLQTAVKIIIIRAESAQHTHAVCDGGRGRRHWPVNSCPWPPPTSPLHTPLDSELFLLPRNGGCRAFKY